MRSQSGNAIHPTSFKRSIGFLLVLLSIGAMCFNAYAILAWKTTLLNLIGFQASLGVSAFISCFTIGLLGVVAYLFTRHHNPKTESSPEEQSEAEAGWSEYINKANTYGHTGRYLEQHINSIKTLANNIVGDFELMEAPQIDYHSQGIAWLADNKQKISASLRQSEELILSKIQSNKYENIQDELGQLNNLATELFNYFNLIDRTASNRSAVVSYIIAKLVSDITAEIHTKHSALPVIQQQPSRAASSSSQAAPASSQINHLGTYKLTRNINPEIELQQIYQWVNKLFELDPNGEMVLILTYYPPSGTTKNLICKLPDDLMHLKELAERSGSAIQPVIDSTSAFRLNINDAEVCKVLHVYIDDDAYKSMNDRNQNGRLADFNWRQILKSQHMSSEFLSNIVISGPALKK